MEHKRKLKMVRMRVKEELEKKKAHRRGIAERLKVKAKLKEINTMKSAQYQIVITPTKLTGLLYRLRIVLKQDCGTKRQRSSSRSYQQRSSTRSSSDCDNDLIKTY
jgi:hypothetical protein